MSGLGGRVEVALPGERNRSTASRTRGLVDPAHDEDDGCQDAAELVRVGEVGGGEEVGVGDAALGAHPGKVIDVLDGSEECVAPQRDAG